MASEDARASLTQEHGRQAAKIKDSSERKAYVAGSGNVDKDYEQTAEETAGMGKKQQTQEILGSQYQLARDARKES